MWVLLWGKGISELKEFPFISKFRVGFETQLMDTSKCIRTVSKIDSHDIWRSPEFHLETRVKRTSLKLPFKDS